MLQENIFLPQVSILKEIRQFKIRKKFETRSRFPKRDHLKSY